MASLPEVLEQACQSQGLEVLLVSNRPLVVTGADGDPSPMGEALPEEELFDALGEVLGPEQQVELAVGNVVEFQVSTSGGLWTMLSEPGPEGIVIRGRRQDAGDDDGGNPLQLPALEPFSPETIEKVPDAPSSQFDMLNVDLDGGAEESGEFVGGGVEPADEIELPPLDGGDDFSVDSDPPGGSPADEFGLLGPDVESGDAAGMLDMPDPDVEFTGGADASESGTGPVPNFGEDATAVAGGATMFDVPVNFGAPGSAPLDPPPEAVGAELGADDAGEAVGGDHSAAEVATGFPEPPDSPGTPAFADGGEDVPHTTRIDLRADVSEEPEPERSEDEPPVSQAAPQEWAAPASDPGPKPTGALGDICLAFGPGAAREFAATFGTAVHAIDDHTSQDRVREIAALSPDSGVIACSVEDPFPRLGWILRRVEEGWSVVVETRAVNMDGARRILLGTDGSPRAEAWLNTHRLRWAQRDGSGGWTIN